MELSKGLSKELSVREEWWWCYMEWEVGWVSPFLARAKPFPIYFKIYIETCVSSAEAGIAGPYTTTYLASSYMWLKPLCQTVWLPQGGFKTYLTAA